MSFTFTRATRRAVKVKMLLTGPSGSGKTFGALKLAEGLAPGKIVVLDSENDRALYYADKVEFDHLTMPDAKPATYLAGMRQAADAGYEVVIVDSLSHAWQNVLDRKSTYDAGKADKSNPYVSWGIFGGEWDAFIRGILELPAHVIATARSKQDYEQVEQNGKKKVIKLGMAPQIREGTDFEFALHFDINEQHKADVRKDNTFLFGDQSVVWDLANGSVIKPLLGWLATAAPVAQPEPETSKAIDDAIAALPPEQQGRARQKWGGMRAKGVSESEAQEVLAALRKPKPDAH